MIISPDQVVTGGRREELAGAAGEMSPKLFPASQSRFHNFSFPTTNWGCQRILRCVNSVSGMGGSAARSTTPDSRLQRETNAAYSPESSLPKSPQASGFKEKEAEGTATGVFMEKDAEQKIASSAAAEGVAVAPAIPWNLRKRKATCYAPQEKGKKRSHCSSPSSLALGSEDSGKAAMRGMVVGQNGPRREFSVSLSRKEIEEDFYAFQGTKPNRRPKKRPKAVQKQLDWYHLWGIERLPENTDDEKLARGVLYDAVVLVDYSFLFPGKEIVQSDRIRNLLVTKLIVTNEAVKIARIEGDHGKVISYLNAYATSSLPSELINLVRKQIGDLSSEKPNNNSPEGLLKWLVHLQQMRKIIFDDEASRYAIQLASEDSNLLAVESASADGEKMDANFILDKGESNVEEMESMDAVFSSAAHSMKQLSSNGRVKRKKSTGDEGNRFKFV